MIRLIWLSTEIPFLVHVKPQELNLFKTFEMNFMQKMHWDGKFLKDLTTKKYVDRLPVLVFGLNVNRILGIPKLASGTDEA